MKKAKVYLDCLDKSFDCYLMNGDWNGWALPCFELETAKKIAEACNNSGGNIIHLYYNQTKDIFYTTEGEKWKGFYFEGVKLYDIGAYSWCWNETTFTKDEIIHKYQLYCLRWLIDHDYTLADLLHELNDYVYEEDNLILAAKLWEQDCGFHGGEIWASFDEWLDNEGEEYRSFYYRD